MATEYNSPEQRLTRFAGRMKGSTNIVGDWPTCKEGLTGGGHLAAGIRFGAGAILHGKAMIGELKGWEFNWALDKSKVDVDWKFAAAAQIYAELSGYVGWSTVVNVP